MNITTHEALEYHAGTRPGKIEVTPTKPCRTQRDLSLAYTPGVSEPCLAIKANPLDAFRYTTRGNLVAVLSNGTAVLGLGNLEDIRAPECFYIEETLRRTMQIPVFHDDQHGTAIISGAALLNALTLAGKDIASVRVVFNGAGAADGRAIPDATRRAGPRARRAAPAPTWRTWPRR